MLAEELGLTAQHDESLEAAPTDPEEWTCRYSQSQSGQPRQQQFIQAIGGYQPDRKTTQWNATMGIGGPPVRNATHVALLVCCSPMNGIRVLHPTHRNGHPLRNMGFCMADSSEDNDFDATMHSPQFIAELFRNTTSNWGQEEWAGGLGDAVERAISDDRPPHPAQSAWWLGLSGSFNCLHNGEDSPRSQQLGHELRPSSLVQQDQG